MKFILYLLYYDFGLILAYLKITIDMQMILILRDWDGGLETAKLEGRKNDLLNEFERKWKLWNCETFLIPNQIRN